MCISTNTCKDTGTCIHGHILASEKEIQAIVFQLHLYDGEINLRHCSAVKDHTSCPLSCRVNQVTCRTGFHLHENYPTPAHMSST